MEKKWNIKIEEISDDEVSCKLDKAWKRAKTVMHQRTKGYEVFGKISHNQNLYNDGQKDAFSEGSTQAIKRKIRAQTIQRVPDGEIITQFDKNSIEQVLTEFLFKKKVLTSEYDGKDMMKNLWRTFNASFDYAFGCVRTGFEKDLDGDVRVSFKLIQWNNVMPSPDCDFIEEADWYMIREWIPRSTLKALICPETGVCHDSTYNIDVVKYILENDLKTGIEPKSMKLADKTKAVTPIESIEVRTMYRRGESEFVTYVPEIKAVLRTVKNYDPRKDVPIHFMILEPDPDFPLGCSSVMWTLGQQQFADAWMNIAYQALLLEINPPIMTFGNVVSSKLAMKPRAIWPMGTNQNNKVEPFKINSTALTQYSAITENIAANMMKNLNITDATVASDANVHGYSATPQGVTAQQQDKTITINQYQKRVEIFFSEFANHALRSYINCMSGKIELTVDEETRRKIWDIESTMNQDKEDPHEDSIVSDDKVTIDFDALSTDLLSFEVRSGSLIENERDSQRKAIQELIVPISQMLPAVSDEGKKPLEQNIMQLIQRLCELSDIDISVQTGARIDEQLVSQALQATMEKVAQQDQDINALAQNQMAMMGQQGIAPQEEGAVSAEFPQGPPAADIQQQPPVPEQGGAEL